MQLFLRSRRVSHREPCQRGVTHAPTHTPNHSLTYSLTHSLSQKYYIYIRRSCGQTSCLRRLNSLTVGRVTWLALQTMTAVTPLVFLKVTNPHRSVIYIYIHTTVSGPRAKRYNPGTRLTVHWLTGSDPKMAWKWRRNETNSLSSFKYVITFRTRSHG